MKILVTGSAGFIGSMLSAKLLQRGDQVVGLDNHNDYYDVKIKYDRLNFLKIFKKYEHHKIDLNDQNSLSNIFKVNIFDKVVNLAAQLVYVIQLKTHLHILIVILLDSQIFLKIVVITRLNIWFMQVLQVYTVRIQTCLFLSMIVLITHYLFMQRQKNLMN